jgi:hypothetical protein
MELDAAQDPPSRPSAAGEQAKAVVLGWYVHPPERDPARLAAAMR